MFVLGQEIFKLVDDVIVGWLGEKELVVGSLSISVPSLPGVQVGICESKVQLDFSLTCLNYLV